jgi:HEAT repeat protein
MKALERLTLTESEQKRVADTQELKNTGSQSVERLIGMLNDPSWVVRRAVVEALASLGDTAVKPLCRVLRTQRDHEARIAAAVDALVTSCASVERFVLELAQESDPAIVTDAAQILGRRRSQSAVPMLVRLIQHDNDNVAVAAIEALGRIGGRAAVGALIDAVGSGNFFRTFPAIDVLGRSGDPRVVEPLANLLSNPSFLPEAARALGRTGERTAVRSLASLLTSTSDSVVRVGAASLWELRERFEEKSGGSAIVIDDLIHASVTSEMVRRLSRVLTGSDDEEAAALCKLLGVVGNAEATPLLAATLDAHPDIAHYAAEALKRLGNDADESLLQALRMGDSARRVALLPAVSRRSSAIAVAECLRDSDPEVRAIACDTLARISNVNVVGQLFPLLEDKNLRVVHSATAAIQTLGSRDARLKAIDASRSQNPMVRRAALRILGYFGHEDALCPLLDGLHDVDPRVREVAIQGLAYVEDQRALQALFDASRDPIDRTRALAMRSLGQVPKVSARVHSVLLKGLHDSDSWVRYYACQSLGRLAYEPATSDIARLLEDKAGQVRAAAVEALSHLDSSTAYDFLTQAATSSDPEVKRAAIVGLGIARRMEAFPIVLAAAASSDMPTKLVAISALVNFPSPLVLDALSKAASDSDEQVRACAIGLLAARPEQEATEVLIELLQNPATHDRARTALMLPSEGHVAGLLVALENAEEGLAPELLSILSRIDRPETRSALLSAFKMRNVAARKAAATVLAARRDPEMTSALLEAMEKDPAAEVREMCSLLLRE